MTSVPHTRSGLPSAPPVINPHLLDAPPARPFVAPQPGPQERFLQMRWVDIVIYGGAAGGGKSFGLLLDAAYHAVFQPVKGYSAVIFRRMSPQIMQPGGLWETSQLVYPETNPPATPRQSPWLGWEWRGLGTSVRFSHMQLDKDKLTWQGAQSDYFGFDELTHFEESQFFYLLSRLRSAHPGGVKPVLRGTTNPDPDSWVKRFLAPWVDSDYPDPARSGEVRYFYRDGDAIIWLRSRDQRPAHIPHTDVRSCTFIEARLEDNPALLRNDPGYRGRLMAMPYVERVMLLGGPEAWNVRREGNMFKYAWFPFVEAIPADLGRLVRRWDLASTEPRRGYSDPDWTVGVLMGRARNGVYYVLDAIFARESPAGIKALIQQTAYRDGRDVDVRLPQDPGQAGKAQLHDFVTLLDGFNVGGDPETGDKVTRAKPFSAQAEVGNVRLLRGHWNEQYLSQLTGFPGPRVHDDAVDASSGAYSWLTRNVGEVPVATTRTHLTPQQRAIEDRADQEARLDALQRARETALGVQGPEGVAHDLAQEQVAEALAAALEDARMVTGYRADGVAVTYETDAARDARLANERRMAQNLRYLESQFGMRATEGFGSDDL